MDVPGVCISPNEGGCGPARSFGSPMIVTFFFGYLSYAPTWGDFKFLAMPLGYCLTEGIDVMFNDNPDMDFTKITTSTEITSMLFYKGGATNVLYYGFDSHYSTQTWKDGTNPPQANPKSEKKGVVK